MKGTRGHRRELFLTKMSKDAIASYDEPYRDWYADEKEYLPLFLSLVGSGKQIMDLAGGYAKAVPHLLQNGNSVVLADLSLNSLRDGREALAHSDVQFVRLNMTVELPFVDGAFDGIWFAEAFEYVPPDFRIRFLRALRRIVKGGGVVFLSAEGLSNEETKFSYLKNYLYWKVVRRAPVVWGEYIYMLDLPKYKGWHYHALVLSRRIERSFRAAGFEILKHTDFGKSEYSSYILRAI
jgi:SAM-dependent methyltransferase